MRQNRFLGDFDLDTGRVTLRDRDIVHQIVRVLRLKTGERIVLGDGAGYDAEGAITSFGKNEIEVVLEKKRKNECEPSRRVILYVAVLKRENFEYAAMKATEAGVAEIRPLVTARTVKTGLNLERLRKIVKEAAEQSGRGVIPGVSEPRPFAEAVQDAKKHSASLFFSTEAGTKDISVEPCAADATVGVFIGPEGGWTREEEEEASRAGFVLSSLGSLTLRAETAALVSVYLAVHGKV